MTAPDDVRAKLLPCPFCGGIAEFEPYKRDGLTLKCESLGCVKFSHRTMHHSIEWLRGKMADRWNLRAAHADLSRDVRELATEVIEAINDGDAQSARNAAQAALDKYPHQEPRA